MIIVRRACSVCACGEVQHFCCIAPGSRSIKQLIIMENTALPNKYCCYVGARTHIQAAAEADPEPNKGPWQTDPHLSDALPKQRRVPGLLRHFSEQLLFCLSLYARFSLLALGHAPRTGQEKQHHRSEARACKKCERNAHDAPSSGKLARLP